MNTAEIELIPIIFSQITLQQKWTIACAIYLSSSAFAVFGTIYTDSQIISSHCIFCILVCRRKFANAHLLKEVHRLIEGNNKQRTDLNPCQPKFALYLLSPVSLQAVFWHSKTTHTAFLILCSASSAWNGATYFFDVFAHRYVDSVGLRTKQHWSLEEAWILLHARGIT